MRLLRTILLATLISFFGGAAYHVYEYYPESIDHPGQFIVNTLMAAPIGIGCPASYRCIQPANNTTTDEFNMNQAFLNFANIMLLPGTYELCRAFAVTNGLDIRGITWHNDDSISAAANAALARTVVTCNDGTFSRFTVGQGFFNATNTQNWSIQNIQFYGNFYQLGGTGNFPCVVVSTTSGGVAGGFVIAHNSMIGCYRGIVLDQSAGGNTQDGQIDDNNIGDNYHDGMYCFGCSDMRTHGNHFGTNGANGVGYDVNFVNSTSNQINTSRFEFNDASILINGGSRIGITGNHFDQVATAVNLTGSAANPVSDVQITGNTGVLSFGLTNLTMVQFQNGGGANTATKISMVNIAGNAWAAFCTNCSDFFATPMGIFGISITDEPDGNMFDTITTGAQSARVLAPYVTWNSDGFDPNGTGQSPRGVNTNQIGMYNTVNTGILSEAFAGGFAGISNLITEDTSNGPHNIASVAGWADASGVSQFTFDAQLKAGATVRNFRYLFSDSGFTNQVGMIFNPSTCTYVGSSGISGTGAVIGTPTANAVAGGFCHVRGTITLGANASGIGTQEWDLVSGTTTSYVGTTGAITISHPTFKYCNAASGTPC